MGCGCEVVGFMYVCIYGGFLERKVLLGWDGMGWESWEEGIGSGLGLGGHSQGRSSKRGKFRQDQMVRMKTSE